MVRQEYAIAYSEVLEILKYIPEEDYKKIPDKIIKLYQMNCDKNYVFNYNPSITLQEQNVSKRARAIIGLLFRDYWATEVQRNKIIAKQNYDRLKLEGKKKEEYNADNIFSNHCKNNPIDNIENKQELSLVEINDIKWYKKIWKSIKDFFRN